MVASIADKLVAIKAGRLSLDGYLDAKVHEATAHLEGMPPAKLETLKGMLREKLATDPPLAELVSIDVLIVDDFALERMTRDESRDVYQLIVERTGRAPTVVTSNRDTAEWLAAFDDTLLAQSAVDRFIHSAYDLVVEGESYRARLKPKLRDDDPPPKTPVAKKPVIGRPR
jgi:hypothetical protein